MGYCSAKALRLRATSVYLASYYRRDASAKVTDASGFGPQIHPFDRFNVQPDCLQTVVAIEPARRSQLMTREMEGHCVHFNTRLATQHRSERQAGVFIAIPNRMRYSRSPQ